MYKDNDITTPTKINNDLMFILVGVVKFIKNVFPKIIFFLYLLGTIWCWCRRWELYNILPLNESFIFLKEFYIALDILFILIMWVLLPIGLFFLFGKSFSIKINELYQTFKNNGFTNRKGQYPLVVSSKKDKNVKKGRIYEFLNFGLDISEWVNRFTKLENWTDSYITYLDYAKHTKRITEIRYIPTRYYEPFRLSTNNDFVSRKLRHGMVVGCSGSGKTYAMKIIAYQFSKLKNVSLFLVDGKNDGYEEFESTDNFYAGDNAVDGINYFYEKIFKYKLKHKEDKEFRKQKHILMVDEYARYTTGYEQ